MDFVSSSGFYGVWLPTQCKDIVKENGECPGVNEDSKRATLNILKYALMLQNMRYNDKSINTRLRSVFSFQSHFSYV